MMMTFSRSALLLGSLVAGATLPACAGPGREQSAERAPSAEPTLLVEVRDASGAAVAGADVWVIQQNRLDPTEAALASRRTGDLVATSRAIASMAATADGSGVARLPRPEGGGVMVAAERGALFGQLELAPPLARRVQLILSERRACPVTVIDHRGTPVAGVALTLGVRVAAAEVGGAQEPPPERVDMLPVTAFTDPAGTATLFVPDDLFRSLDEAALVVVARIPSRARVLKGLKAAVDADLVLPPVGTLSIFAPPATPDGARWNGLIQVFAATEGSRSDSTLAVPLVNGHAKIVGVEEDVELRLNGLIALGDSNGTSYGRLRERLPAVSAAEDNRVEITIRADRLEPFLSGPGSR